MICTRYCNRLLICLSALFCQNFHQFQLLLFVPVSTVLPLSHSVAMFGYTMLTFSTSICWCPLLPSLCMICDSLIIVILGGDIMPQTCITDTGNLKNIIS